MQRAGFIHGTSAALNIELGWIPDYVEVTTLSGTIRLVKAWLGKVIVFTGGGTVEIKAGEWLKGITSGAKVHIRQVILDSGTWAGGNAAGWFVCNAEEITGTVASENMQRYATEPGTATAATNSVTVVVDVEFGVDIDTEIALVTGNAGILSYKGDETNGYAKGFTIGSTISADGVLLGYVAVKNAPGEGQGARVLGNQQSTLW